MRIESGVGLAPRVSIGLPVRNGARYLAAALDSLLAQTFEDFELIISDNASTDATPEICFQYAARDSRIRFSRLEADIGGFRNHNRVAGLARGEYFTWAAHDDLRAPEHLAKCVSGLDDDRGAVVCYAPERRIDERGAALPCPAHCSPGAGTDPAERWLSLLSGDWVYEPHYGAIRLAALRRTGLLGQHADADRALLAELALHGRFLRLGEALMIRRIHQEISTLQYDSTASYTAWFAPERAGRPSYNRLGMLRSLLGGIRRAPVPWPVRRRCLRELVRWVRTHRTGLSLELGSALRLTGRPPGGGPIGEAHHDAA